MSSSSFFPVSRRGILTDLEAALSDHYTCRICDQKGHWIQECPEKETRDAERAAQRENRGPREPIKPISRTSRLFAAPTPPRRWLTRFGLLCCLPQLTSAGSASRTRK